MKMQSASQRAYREAVQRLGETIIRKSQTELPQYGLIAANARLRETEIAALLDFLIEAGVCTRDQYFDKCATMMEKVATALEQQPAIAKVNGHG